MLRPSFVLALGLLAAGCGNHVIDETGAGGSGSTTSSGTTGSETTTGSPGTGGTGGSTTGSTTAPPTVCGGKMGKPCAPEEFCSFAPEAICGYADGTGLCLPRPGTCTDDCPGVCGCDGQLYCNECDANAAGVSINPSGACSAMTDTYRALSMFTNMPRYLIAKASPSRNLCFRLVVEMQGAVGIGISGDGWSVVSATVTNQAADCELLQPGPPPPPVGAELTVTESVAGSGVLTMSQSSTGECTTGIHGQVDFPMGTAWAPTLEAFDADALPIEGGCP